MKLSLLSSLLCLLILAQGCDFKMNTNTSKKDPIPNSSFKAKGLNSDPVTMTIDGEATTSNIFTFGTVIKFTFNNVTGLKRIKGLAYPGMTMHITDSKDSTVVHIDDLLEKTNNGTDLSPLLLDAQFNANLAHLNGEKYNLELNVWDKKGSGSITFNLPFEIKASDLLSIDDEGIGYSNIYLWDQTEKKVVFDQKINMNHEFILINEGIEGLDVVDGLAYPGMSLLIVDKNGNEILANENLLTDISESGIDPIELKENQAPVTFSFTSGATTNPCHLTMRIFDLKNPEKHITVETPLELEW